jgi:hypothetical protein
MALKFNNTSIPANGTVRFNNTSLQTVKYANTQVWKKAPDYLLSSGNQYTDYTGGWSPKAYYFLGTGSETDLLCYNQTPLTPSWDGSKFSFACTGNYLGGGSVVTNSKVDFSAINQLTASVNNFDNNLTSYFFLGLAQTQPTPGQNTAFSALIRYSGEHQWTSMVLDTSALSGSYYVVCGFSNNNYRTFTGHLYSIACGH